MKGIFFIQKNLQSCIWSFDENLSVKGERKNNFAALVDKPAPRCPLKVESFSDEIGKKSFFGVEDIEELAKSKNLHWK